MEIHEIETIPILPMMEVYLGTIASEEEDNPQFSPLQLDTILSEILGLLTISDLKTCRLVSSQWNLRSISLLRRKRPIVTFHSTKKLRGRSSSCSQKIKEFNSVMKSSVDIPYCAYQLKNISLRNPIVKEFLQICSHSIRVLILDISKKFIKPLEFKSLLLLLAPSLEVLDIDYLPTSVTNPRTKDLTLDSDIPSTNDNIMLNIKKISFPACEGHYCPEFWGTIFKCAKKLEEININYEEHTSSFLKGLVDSGRLSQLSSLRLEFIGNEHIDVFLNRFVDLRLTEFKFNIISSEVPSRKLEQLLSKLSSTLTVLAMGSPSNDGRMRLRLPKMPELRRLGMFHCDDSLITLESINFSESTPKLKALEMSSGISNFDWQDYLSVITNLDSSPCKTVEELTIALLVSDPQCVQYLEKMFPNVKKLSLEFPRKDFLRAVWNSWSDLVELTLYLHVNKDDSKDRFICGIPSEWKENIKKNFDLSQPDWWKDIEDPAVVDSICNLKSLQRLTIEQSPDSGKLSDLTDFSVFFGFVKLRNLRELKIGRSQISPHCQQFLWEDLPMISRMDIRDERGPGMFSSEEREELVSYIKYYENKEYGDDEHDEQE